MILLDTNVLSALMRDVPDLAVVRWLNSESPDRIWTTTITVYELRFGVARLPNGRKRQRLEEALEALLQNEFAGRIAPFDVAAAHSTGRLAAERSAQGRPIDLRDTMIAGIAAARKATIATRNIRHFNDLDLIVFSPWGS